MAGYLSEQQLAEFLSRFITVDADIEYYPNTPEFYKKNGFVMNESRKRRPSDKTISMRRDIFA